VNLSNGANVRPLPANMTAALSAGARPQLVELNGPVNMNLLFGVRASVPVSLNSTAMALSPDSTGATYLTLAEGDYVVTPLLVPAGRSFGNQIPQPVTSDMYKMKATSGGVDLEAGELKVSNAGQEIQFTFTPAR
jgi:hypothetical protein